MASQGTEFVLAYDASCGPCSRFKAVLEFLDPRRRIEFVSLEKAERSGKLAGIAPSKRYASFHLIRPAHGDELRAEVLSGSSALLPLVGSLSPGGVGISRAVQAIPGGSTGASFVYSVFSRLHRGCQIVQAAHGALKDQGRLA